MSQAAPGKYASQKEKDCAEKTGYKFVEPMVDPTGTKTNTPAVTQAYRECLVSAGEGDKKIPAGQGDPNKKIFTTRNIVIAIVIIIIVLLAVAMAKVHRNAP